jgi:hypothetical protein
MGSTYLQGIMDTGLNIRAKLEWHLTGNCYPPIHHDFHETAFNAIKLVAEGKSEQLMKLPNGISLKAWQIVDQLYLEFFVEELINQSEENE